jgi:hypothetical protein
MEQFENEKIDHNILAAIRGENIQVDVDIKGILAEFCQSRIRSCRR